MDTSLVHITTALETTLETTVAMITESVTTSLTAVATTEGPVPDTTETPSQIDTTTEGLTPQTTEFNTQPQQDAMHTELDTTLTFISTSNIPPSTVNSLAVNSTEINTKVPPSGGDLDRMYIGIIVPCGVVVFIIVVLIIFFCCKRNKCNDTANSFDDPENKKDVHTYGPKSVRSNRYVADPTSQTSPGDISLSTEYQEIAVQSIERRRHVTVDIHESAHNIQMTGVATTESGTYAGHISDNYQGSFMASNPYNARPDDRPSGAPELSRHSSENSNSKAPKYSAATLLEASSLKRALDKRAKAIEQKRSGMESPRSVSTHSDQATHQAPYQPRNVQQPVPNTETHSPVRITPTAKPDGRPEPNSCQPSYSYQPQQRTEAFQNSNQSNQETVRPKIPPATKPKPKRHAPITVDMATLKKQLKPTQPKQTTANTISASVDELAGNALFQRLKGIIEGGCNTLRLYKTPTGIAFQPISTEEEEEMYYDTEVTPESLPIGSFRMSSYTHDGGDEENIYDFIRSSVFMYGKEMSSEPTIHEEIKPELPTIIELPNSESAADIYQDPDDFHGTTQVYERGDMHRSKLPHEEIKEKFSGAGFLQELQGRIPTNIPEELPTPHSPPASPDGYVNIPSTENCDTLPTAHKANSVKSKGYVNVPTDQGVTGHQTHRVLGKGYVNVPGSQMEPQKDYANHGFQAESPICVAPPPPQDSEVYQNEVIDQPQHTNAPKFRSNKTLNAPENSTYNNVVLGSDEIYENQPDIRLRASMGPEALDQSIDKLFGNALQTGDDTALESTNRQALPPVVQRKQSQKTKDQVLSNYRISRSSFFGEIEQESGPDLHPSHTGLSSQMLTATPLPLKTTRGGFFSMFKK